MTNNKNILVIAAHSDDEALGCGGTLARHVREGDRVYALFMTDGVGARNEGDIEERRKAAQKSAEAIGITQCIFNQFPDNAMDTVALLDIVKAVESAIREINPHIIYTHHSGDLNIDHAITARAVLTACRPLPGANIKAIYGFEVLSSTEWAGPSPDNAFCPNHFVEISEDFATKMKSIDAYNLEMRAFPHPRSAEAIEAQAILRGAQAGVHKAEAFTTIRTIQRSSKS